jgi:hypothetical protein
VAGASIRQKSVQALIALAVLAGVVAGGWVQQASAAGGAAIRRAVVQVDDEVLTVEVVVNARYLQTIRGPIRLVVTLPAGAQGTLVSADRGFTGSGWSVNFVKGRVAGVGNVAVTVLSRQHGVAIEVDLSSDAGWAYGVPGTANVTSIIEFYPSTPGLPGPVALRAGAVSL